MAINIDLKKIPPYIRVIISLIPVVIFIALFVTLVYQPKSKEILSLQGAVAALDKEISSGEVKIRKLDQLIAENALLKAKLAALQEHLPAEQEVTELLKQVSDLGLKSGLEILLWKPGARRAAPSGLYAEIPVEVEVITGYHDLGDFYSHISRLARIVNISGLKISVRGRGESDSKGLNSATFTAVTFVASNSGEETK
ncbi:MAG: type 4a pilus biogenesis protein PilO [Nitrospirae bacterium]|nr:type 4a pilus biogenesis protein PilO [Nitrospirota bacterium]